MLTDPLRQHAAQILRDAERRRTPVDPLTGTFPEIGAEDAYEI
ncbi:hypothetical protein ACIRFH_10120 [Streptomyces sp. NPDC093586]